MSKKEKQELAKKIDDARIEWAKGNSEYANMELQRISMLLRGIK